MSFCADVVAWVTVVFFFFLPLVADCRASLACTSHLALPRPLPLALALPLTVAVVSLTLGLGIASLAEATNELSGRGP
jgi:hypothetical protein